MLVRHKSNNVNSIYLLQSHSLSSMMVGVVANVGTIAQIGHHGLH